MEKIEYLARMHFRNIYFNTIHSKLLEIHPINRYIELLELAILSFMTFLIHP